MRRKNISVQILTFLGDVDGTVGDGRMFNRDTVDIIRSLNFAVDKNSCCEECIKLYPDTTMVNYYKFPLYDYIEQGCDCLKPLDNPLTPPPEYPSTSIITP